jgi:transposase
LECRATALTLESYLEQQALLLGHLRRLEAGITEQAANCEYAKVIDALMCFRGIDLTTGYGLAVEIGDWTGFTGSSIGAFLGLVPSEHSSGASRSQGSITKAGNTYARRLLIEAAWQHDRPFRQPGKRLLHQFQLVDPATRIRALEGNRRLHRAWERSNANTAIARELAGWCWSVAAPLQQREGAAMDAA